MTIYKIENKLYYQSNVLTRGEGECVVLRWLPEISLVAALDNGKYTVCINNTFYDLIYLHEKIKEFTL